MLHITIMILKFYLLRITMLVTYFIHIRQNILCVYLVFVYNIIILRMAYKLLLHMAYVIACDAYSVYQVIFYILSNISYCNVTCPILFCLYNIILFS